MKEWLMGRPDPSEFAPYAAAYVDLVQGADVCRTLAALTGVGTWLTEAIDDRTASTRSYAPGKWTLKEVVGHVIDTERVFAYRALCVGRGESASLPGFDQDSYVRAARFNDQPLSELIDEFDAVRASTILLISRASADAWARRGVVNGFSVTMRGLAFHIAGHELHHVRQLRERYLGRWRAG